MAWANFLLPIFCTDPKPLQSQGQSLAKLERRQIVLQLLKACRKLNELVASHLNGSYRALQGCRTAGNREHAAAAALLHISVLWRVTERTREAAKVALRQAQGSSACSTLPEHQPTWMSLQKYPQASNLQTEFSLIFFWTSHLCPFPFTLPDKILK